MKIKLGTLLKTVLPATIGIGLLVLVMAYVAGVGREKIAPAHTEVAVRKLDPNNDYPIDVVHEVVKEYEEEAVGTLKAATRTEVSSRVMAVIDRMAVRAGDTVKRGDVLVELDKEAFEAQQNQAEAALAAAEAALAKAQDAYDRALRLRKSSPGAISEQEYNELLFNLESAKANRARAQQAVTEARINLSYTTIRAPKDGLIVDRLAEEGDTARPGVPLLVLYDPTSLRLEVPVMENLAVKLEVGQKVDVHIDAVQRTVQGVIDEIVPQAESASRSFLVKVKLPRAEGLFEGMFGRLKISSGQRVHYCLNMAAIQRIGQLEFVDVVRPDGTLERRLITTGRIGMPGRIEVLSGLKPGERVLLHSPPETTETTR